MACTSLLTHYHLDDKRGQPAIDAYGILRGLRAPQVAVHDGWMPYFKKPTTSSMALTQAPRDSAPGRRRALPAN